MRLHGERSRVLKEKSAAITKAVDSIIQATKHYSRGDVIRYTLLESRGVFRDRPPFGTVVKKLRRYWQKERGVTLKAIPNVGFQLAQAEEQITELNEKRTRRGMRQIRWGIEQMTTIPTEELDDHSQRMRAAKVDNQTRAMKIIRHVRKRDAILSGEYSERRQ